MTEPRDIRLTCRTVDRCRKTARFTTIEGARRFAHRWIGEQANLGPGYAVSFDGVATLTADGCSLAELWPPRTTPVPGRDRHDDP